MPLAETVIAAKLLHDAAVGRPHVSASLDRVLQILVGHLQDRRGIVVLTGPEGSGKTIALRQLAIDAEPGVAAKTIAATARTTAEDIYKAVLEALKATPSENEAPLARIRRALSPATTPYPALLVDDAEKLSPSALAALVELAAPGSGFPAVTVLLATRRASSELLRGRTLAEAIAGTIAMPRLSPGQVEHFLRSRLRAARLPLETFPGPVMEALGNLAGGLPGPLTRLAGEALERAAGAGRSTVTLADVADGGAPAPSSAPLPPPIAPAPAPEEAALENALRAAVEDARPVPAPASSGLPPITIAPRPNERPPRPAPSPSAAAAAPPPPAPAPQRRRAALKAGAVAAVALAAVATPALLLGPRLLEQWSEPAAPPRGPTALVVPSGGSDATPLSGQGEENTTAAMPAAAARPSPEGTPPETAAGPAPGVETAAPSTRVTEAGPPEPPPFPAEEPVGGTLPAALSAAASSGSDPVLFPVAATAAASEAVVGDAAAREAAEPASPETLSAMESMAPPDPSAAVESAAADAAGELAPPPEAIEETGAAELEESPSSVPLPTAEPAEIAVADPPAPSAPLPEPIEPVDAAEVPALPEPGALMSAEPADGTAAGAPETSPPPAEAVAAEAAEPSVSGEEIPAPSDLASTGGQETSAGSAEPAEAVPPEPAASAVVAPAPIEDDSGAAPAPGEPEGSLAAAATIDSIVGAPQDEPLDPDELVQLFREAEAAIAAAEAARARTAPASAETAELDPDLRRLFEQFLQSLEAAPRKAGSVERSLHETFQLFLARNAHLFGKAEGAAGAPATKPNR